MRGGSRTTLAHSFDTKLSGLAQSKSASKPFVPYYSGKFNFYYVVCDQAVLDITVSAR